jgi:hypothetical protein
MRQQLQIVKGQHEHTATFARIEDAVAALRAGKMVIIVDDEDRENEGDLTIAAEKITPEAINFMARYGRGLICLAMTPERLDELEIPLMVVQNSSRFETAFCVSVGRTVRQPGFQRLIALRRYLQPLILKRNLLTWSAPVMCSRCGHVMLECWSELDKRKLRWISLGSPAWHRPA